VNEKEENCVAKTPAPQTHECAGTLARMSPKEELLQEIHGRESELIRKLTKLNELRDRIRFSNDFECNLAAAILQLQWL
jgi:hypothetical protein